MLNLKNKTKQNTTKPAAFLSTTGSFLTALVKCVLTLTMKLLVWAVLVKQDHQLSHKKTRAETLRQKALFVECTSLIQL